MLEAVATKVLPAIAIELAKKIVNISAEKIKEKSEQASEAQIKENIENELEYISSVKTIWSNGKNISIDKIYFPTSLSERSTESLFINHEFIDETEKINLEEILGEKNIIIQGIVGQGKSMFLRHFAIEKTKSEKKIPIFIELSKISKDNSLCSEIASHLLMYNLPFSNKPNVAQLRSLSNFILYLDAFDEINSNSVNSTIVEIEKIAKKKYSNIIITTRPNSHITKSTLFKSYSLNRLKKSDFAIFINKIDSIDEGSKHNLKQKIDDLSQEFTNVISTPLMLTLFIMVFLSNIEIPESTSEFYSKLFSTVFSRHDNLKIGFEREKKCKVSESSLLELFEAFSYISKSLGLDRTLNTSQFSTVFEKSVGVTNSKVTMEEDFKHDIIKGTNLLLEDGFDRLTYTHKSFQEYYSAAFINKIIDPSISEKFYNLANSQYVTWNETLRYLSEIDKVRFSKNFAIPLLKPRQHEIEQIKALKTASAKVKRFSIFMEKNLPNWEIILSVRDDRINGISGGQIGLDSDDNYEQDGFNMFRVRTVIIPIFQFIENQISETDTNKQPHLRLSVSAFREKTGIQALISSENNIQLRMPILIRSFNPATLDSLIEYMHYHLDMALERYEKIVAIDKNKISLFT